MTDFWVLILAILAWGLLVIAIQEPFIRRARRRYLAEAAAQHRVRAFVTSAERRWYEHLMALTRPGAAPGTQPGTGAAMTTPTRQTPAAKDGVQ